MIYSDQNGFQPQIIAQSVCLRGAFAARPQQSANTSPRSSLMC